MHIPTLPLTLRPGDRAEKKSWRRVPAGPGACVHVTSPGLTISPPAEVWSWTGDVRVPVVGRGAVGVEQQIGEGVGNGPSMGARAVSRSGRARRRTVGTHPRETPRSHHKRCHRSSNRVTQLKEPRSIAPRRRAERLVWPEAVCACPLDAHDPSMSGYGQTTSGFQFSNIPAGFGFHTHACRMYHPSAGFRIPIS